MCVSVSGARERQPTEARVRAVPSAPDASRGAQHPATRSETPAVRLGRPPHRRQKACRDETPLSLACLLVHTFIRYQLLCLRECAGCFHDDCLLEIDRF